MRLQNAPIGRCWSRPMFFPRSEQMLITLWADIMDRIAFLRDRSTSSALGEATLSRRAFASSSYKPSLSILRAVGCATYALILNYNISLKIGDPTQSLMLVGPQLHQIAFPNSENLRLGAVTRIRVPVLKHRPSASDGRRGYAKDWGVYFIWCILWRRRRWREYCEAAWSKLKIPFPNLNLWWWVGVYHKSLPVLKTW